jgi:hypothetical protein
MNGSDVPLKKICKIYGLEGCKWGNRNEENDFEWYLFIFEKNILTYIVILAKR